MKPGLTTLKIIASEISGYEGYIDMEDAGAPNDAYYELDERNAKINFVLDVAEYLNYSIPMVQAERIVDFLDSGHCGQDAWQRAFEEL